MFLQTSVTALLMAEVGPNGKTSVFSSLSEAHNRKYQISYFMCAIVHVF